MNKTSIPFAYCEFKILVFSNFDYGRYLPLTMDIDEPWFGG
jgi:hypothetical protein